MLLADADKRNKLGDNIHPQTLTQELFQPRKQRNETMLEFLEKMKLFKSQVATFP